MFIGSRIAAPNASNSKQGGIKGVGYKPSVVTIRRRHQLNGKICIFDDVKNI